MRKCLRDDCRDRLVFHRAMLPFLLFEVVMLYGVFSLSAACGV